MLEILEDNINSVLALRDDDQLENLVAKLKTMQQELLKKVNDKEDYNQLLEEIEGLRVKREKLQIENADKIGKSKQIYEMKSYLDKNLDILDEYDEPITRRLLEKITVYDDRFEIEFKSGISVELSRE